jgi:hypothetical protein
MRCTFITQQRSPLPACQPDDAGQLYGRPWPMYAFPCLAYVLFFLLTAVIITAATDVIPCLVFLDVACIPSSVTTINHLANLAWDRW